MPQFALARPDFLRRSDRGAGLAGKIAIGLGALIASAAGAWFLRKQMTEEARHTVLASDGAFSLRRYDPVLMAQARRTGERGAALTSGFRTLADYIFAKPYGRPPGASQDKVAMAAPVLATPGHDPGEWLVRFTIPRKWSLLALPEASRGIEMVEVPRRILAALKFSGDGRETELVERKTKALQNWVTTRGLTAVGEPEYAYFDAPFIPEALRRNEVWIEVASDRPTA